MPEQVSAHVYAHVYVHVPFCARRCSYCDFAIAVRRTVPWQEYAQALHNECEVRALAMQAAPLRTLYFGGGTPSRLGDAGVTHMVETLREHFTWRSDAEITLEANPEDITPGAVSSWRAAGINRLSIGIQSFHDPVLAWMHRVHDAETARRAVHIARDGGLSAFSIDLIFATPERLGRDWERDLADAVSLDPDHISLYGLTVEPHTPLGRWHERGQEHDVSEDRYEDEFLAAHAVLATAGYDHYEVSNFARPGHRAVHNSAYWQGVPYLGLGPSAHGFDGSRRRWNVSAFAAWEQVLGNHVDPIAGDEQLTMANHEAERVYLGLRTTDGLPVTEIERQHVQPWLDAGWARLVEGTLTTRLVCTPLGWLRLDALAADLTAFRSHS